MGASASRTGTEQAEDECRNDDCDDAGGVVFVRHDLRLVIVAEAALAAVIRLHFLSQGTGGEAYWSQEYGAGSRFSYAEALVRFVYLVPAFS